MPILAFDRLTKHFPGVTALADVSFEVQPGHCHAIVGENGAGKSTLGRIVAGLHRPDSGRVLIDGRPVRFGSPLAAAAAGVSIVHQELAFCRNLSIAENLFLGRTPAAGGFVSRTRLQRSARALLERVGLALDPATPVAELSTGQEQLLQIAIAIGRAARIVIMDEPTSSLSAAEAERLFERLAELRRSGVTVLYISHRLPEIARLCDRVTVLRDGRHVATRDVADTAADELVRLMIGRPLSEYFPQHLAAAPGGVLLRVEHLTSPGRFEDISFELRAGEILGLAGLVGAGRSELARAVFGLDRFGSGAITLAPGLSTPAPAPRLSRRAESLRSPPPTFWRSYSPRRSIARGLGLLPEDRQHQGLVLSMNCRENISLASLDRLSRLGLINAPRERALAREYAARLNVRTPSIDAPVAGLSGGNQQKIALARWLARDCQVLILDEPTRGVDVGAKAEIHALIDQLAAAGRGILLVSSELPELLALATRIVVLARGRIVAELPRAAATQDVLLRHMAGVPA
jgi:ABC-type sugar transport system ATPase subunit